MTKIDGYGDKLTVNGVCIGELSPKEHEKIEKERINLYISNVDLKCSS